MRSGANSSLPAMPSAAADLSRRITACTLCADRFAATATAHEPRPVVWFDRGARLLIAGQAPGLRVHEAGRPFADPSGDRLRQWLGRQTLAGYPDIGSVTHLQGAHRYLVIVSTCEVLE